MSLSASQRAVDERAFLRRLEGSGVNVAHLVGSVKRLPELMRVLTKALRTEGGCLKFGASKLLRILSAEAPELVYPQFDVLLSLVKSKNSFLRWNAMLTLANLAAVDRQKKLDSIMDAYLSPIGGPAMIDAANTMRGAAVIARAKPYLADKIAGQVMQVENARYAKPECRNVAIGHAIRALDDCFSVLSDKAAVLAFVSRQTKNTRAATREKASSFCKKRLAGNAPTPAKHPSVPVPA